MLVRLLRLLCVGIWRVSVGSSLIYAEEEGTAKNVDVRRHTLSSTMASRTGSRFGGIFAALKMNDWIDFD